MNKAEIESLISDHLRKIPYQVVCAGLFGSFVKAEEYRDIDILVVVSDKEEVEPSRKWIQDKCAPSLKNIRLDIKCYDQSSLLIMFDHQDPLALSLAVEIKFIITQKEIENSINKTKKHLIKNGIDVTSKQAWKIERAIIHNILAEEYKPFRGFLISHLDWIENYREIAKPLLTALAPIEEPYTRIACLKKTIQLFSSKIYRQKLGFSSEDIITIATQIVSH